MKFTVKDVDISSGGVLVAILNKRDAQKLDIHNLDRIKVIKGDRVETAVVDIATGRTVKPGHIGLFEEMLSSLHVKNKDSVHIMLARKPLSLDFIKKKLDGKKLNAREIDQIVWDITHNKLSDTELTYFVSACYTNLMDFNETIMLTKSIVAHGTTLKLRKYPIIDKHSIGGVPGNRTTMLIVPIIAAAGLYIPKTSSRSITSPAGTADTMEVLAPVSFAVEKMRKIVEKTKGCIVWGGALNLAPADDKIIKVEKPLSIDAESQLLASIMAKKLSVGSTHILIDIPIGKGSKIEKPYRALKLKREFEAIARRLKRKINVVITDGSQPIGRGIGPALEARDVLDVLSNNDGAEDLRKKSVHMAGLILEMAGKARKGQGEKLAAEILESGKAYEKMREIIKAQGGNTTSSSRIKVGKHRYGFRAYKSGRVTNVDPLHISRIARIAGAPTDKGAGIYLHYKRGDKVKKSDTLFTIHAENSEKLKFAVEALQKDVVVIR
ncbi:AMP phosphorylase [Candidatus Woesearchaeota archaeon]|nr:AMP phosphorylase [Candidatus Woesearchaeota archaeon]